jgi:hypothetical protein
MQQASLPPVPNLDIMSRKVSSDEQKRAHEAKSKTLKHFRTFKKRHCERMLHCVRNVVRRNIPVSRVSPLISKLHEIVCQHEFLGKVACRENKGICLYVSVASSFFSASRTRMGEIWETCDDEEKLKKLSGLLIL